MDASTNTCLESAIGIGSAEGGQHTNGGGLPAGSGSSASPAYGSHCPGGAIVAPYGGLTRWGNLADDDQRAFRALASSFGAMSVPQTLGRAAGDWLVKGLLGSPSLAVLAGSPGVGKSFLVLDLALSIVHGLSWHGLRTRDGAVLYVAAEGGAGLAKRLKAWHVHHGRPIDRPGLLVVDRAVQLADERTVDLAKLLHLYAAAADRVPRLIVIDTLARCAIGLDENSAQDMGQLIDAAESLKRASGCCVLLVHHTGKDASRGLRGSSALTGAIDSSLIVTAEQGTLRMHTAKQKDDRERTFTFRLQQVPLGHDADGDPISSCVAVDVDQPLPSPSAQPVLTDRQKAVIEMVANWPNPNISRRDLSMRYRDRFQDSRRRKDCADVVKQLVQKGILGADRDRVWLNSEALIRSGA